MEVSEQTPPISNPGPELPQKPDGKRKQLVLKPKKIFYTAVTLAALFAVVLFSAPPFIFHSRPMEKILADRIQQVTGGEFRYEGFSVSYFPFLSVRFEDLKLHSLAPTAFDLQADALKIRLARFPLLFGHFRIHALELAGAKGAVEFPETAGLGKEIVPFQDVRVKTGPVRSGAQVRVELAGSFEGAPNALSMKGTVRPVTPDRLSAMTWMSTF